MRVQRYLPSDAAVWDAFVDGSVNATFLLRRGYMDYHADRFQDHSLMVRDDADRVVALLPADRKDDVVRSHGGLTYGGLVTSEAMTQPLALEIFDTVVQALREQGLRRLVYKTIPAIYHRMPADADLYCLFRHGATLFRRDVLSVIDYHCRGPVQSRRDRSLRRARKAGMVVRQDADYDQFWPILTSNLQSRYGVNPVHALEEIRLLAERFPENIRFCGAYRGDEMLAGAVLYVSARVCHVQYNAATPEGKELGALDLVLDQALQAFAAQVRYFDFGACTESDGHVLNTGLVEYKEGFGARTIVHDMYELDLTAPQTGH